MTAGLRFSRVSFGFEPTTPVLRDVDLELLPGEVVALLGTNGSGKSTLCRLACGLLRPDDGDITIDGVPGSQRHWTAVQYVPQDPDDTIAWPRVFDDVAFAPRNAGRPESEVRDIVRDVLAAFGLGGFEGRDVATLSAGERQRVALAGALAARPRYLLLDEPAAQLDPLSAWRILRSVAELSVAGDIGVLLVTHRAALLPLCHRAMVLSGGSIVRRGPARELAADAPWLRAHGIEPPPIAVLAEELAQRGWPLPRIPVRLKELAACLASRHG
jgi:energy-coupling factor transporter ATP-binding protein EcfA2